MNLCWFKVLRLFGSFKPASCTAVIQNYLAFRPLSPEETAMLELTDWNQHLILHSDSSTSANKSTS